MENILFFIESLSSGGAEKVLVTLLNHIDYSKYRITLLTLVDTGVFKKNLDLIYAYKEEMTVLSSHGNNLIYLGEKDKWQVEKISVKTWRPWDESETLFYITKGQILSIF